MDLKRLLAGVENNYSFDDATIERVQSYFLGQIAYQEIKLTEENAVSDYSINLFMESLEDIHKKEKQTLEADVIKRAVSFYFAILDPDDYSSVFSQIDLELLLKVYPDFYEEVLSEEKILFGVFNRKSSFRIEKGIRYLAEHWSPEKAVDFVYNNPYLKTEGHYNYENNLRCILIREGLKEAVVRKSHDEVKNLTLKYLSNLAEDYLCSYKSMRNGETKGNSRRTALSEKEKAALLEVIDTGENWGANIEILKSDLRYIDRGIYLRGIIALFEEDKDFTYLFKILKSIKESDQEWGFVDRFFKMVLELAPRCYIQAFYFQTEKEECHWKNVDDVLEKFECEMEKNDDLKDLLADYMVTYTIEHFDCCKKVHQELVRMLFDKYGLGFMLKHFKYGGLRDKVTGFHAIFKHVTDEEDLVIADKLESEIQMHLIEDIAKAICIDDVAANAFKEYLIGNIPEISPEEVLKKKIRRTGNFTEYYIFQGDILERFVSFILRSQRRILTIFLMTDFHIPASDFPHEKILKAVMASGEDIEEFLEVFAHNSENLTVFKDGYYYKGNDYEFNIFHKGLNYLESNGVKCLEMAKKFTPRLKEEVINGIYFGVKPYLETQTLVDYLSDKQKGVREAALRHLKSLDMMAVKEVENKLYSELETYSGELETMAIEVVCQYASDVEKLRDIYDRVSEPRSREKIAETIGLEIKDIYRDEKGDFDLDAYLEKVYVEDKKFPLDLAKFSLPQRKDGKNADLAIKQFIVGYKNSDELSINKEALVLAECFNKDGLKEFAESLFNQYTKGAMDMKEKWQMLIPIIHGDYNMIQNISKLIEELAASSRQKLAAYFLKALGLNGTKDGFVAIDRIARKTKFKSIRTAGEEAFEIAANELGISKGELGDNLVGDMGLEEGYIPLQYGNQELKLFVGNDLKFLVEKEDGKRVKSLPKIGKDEDPELFEDSKERFKLLKKELKDMAALQTDRMEDALVEWRLWDVSKWKELFLNNTIMNIIGRKILWGTYRDDELITAFTLKDELKDVDGKNVELNSNDSIGIVHVLELTKDEIDSWMTEFNTANIEILFNQLERENMITEETCGQEYKPNDFPRKNPSTLINRLRKKGWNIGSVRDAGSFNEIYRELRNLDIGIEISLIEQPYMGYYGYETDSDDGAAGVGKIEFYRLGKIKRGSYEYDELEEHEGLRYDIESLPKRIVSELLREARLAFN